MTTPQPPQAEPTSPSAPGAFGPAEGYGQTAAAQGETPGQAFGAYPPAPAAPKSNTAKKVLIGVGTLILVVAVKFGISFAIGYAAADKPVHAKAGQCVKVTGSDTNPKVDTVDCGSADANYTVISVVDNSFDPGACDKVDGSTAGLAQQLLTDKFVLCLADKKK